MEKNPLLEYFVVDEWAQILAKLTDYNDRWNASHADPLFRNILKYPTDAWMTALFYKALPYLYKYLSSNEILKLRELNKSWKNILDQFLENDQRWRDVDHNGFHKVRLNLFEHPTVSRRQRFTNLFEQMSSTSQAKIVGGSVFIDDTTEEDEYTQIEFRPLFWRFGQQIYHLSMKMHVSYNASPIQSWKAVIDLFVHTSNLKTLNLEFAIEAQDEENGPWVWYRQLAKLFQKRRLPPLKKLKSLRLVQYGIGINSSLDTDMPPCQAFVTAYGKQLEYLHIPNMLGPIAIPRKLNNLEYLTCAIRRLDELQAFEKLNSPKLTKLNLIMYHETKLAYPLKHVEFLDKFKDTLKVLNISSWIQKRTGLLGSPSQLPNGLCLPNLEKLTLWDCGLTRNPGLKFLLNFPKLQSFDFSWKLKMVNDWGDQSQECGVDVEYDIGEYLNHKRLIDKIRFYNKCPIWNLLKYLDRVELESRVGLEKYKSICTRQERQIYELRSLKQQ